MTRVEILGMDAGSEFKADGTKKVAINSYRAGGELGIYGYCCVGMGLQSMVWLADALSRFVQSDHESGRRMMN